MFIEYKKIADLLKDVPSNTLNVEIYFHKGEAPSKIKWGEPLTQVTSYITLSLYDSKNNGGWIDIAYEWHALTYEELINHRREFAATVKSIKECSQGEWQVDKQGKEDTYYRQKMDKSQLIHFANTFEQQVQDVAA